MLQRVQTIYMLASVVAVLMMFCFPLASFQIPEATFSLSAFGLSSLTPEVPVDVMRWTLLLLLLIMFALPLVTIFLYNKRKLQLRLLIFTAVLDVLFYAYFYLFEIGACEEIARSASEVATSLVSKSGMISAVMPAISFVSCVMAIKGVLYDIALLASTDRLRSKKK